MLCSAWEFSGNVRKAEEAKKKKTFKAKTFKYIVLNFPFHLRKKKKISDDNGKINKSSLPYFYSSQVAQWDQ
jgi:hypothetical protein